MTSAVSCLTSIALATCERSAIELLIQSCRTVVGPHTRLFKDLEPHFAPRRMTKDIDEADVRAILQLHVQLADADTSDLAAEFPLPPPSDNLRRTAR